MDWSIQEIARLAGTTSRTLRHYGEVGLLEATRTGSNGYRYYDEQALVRLQRILLLRDLGLGLPAIGEVLENERDSGRALLNHLTWLQREQDRLARQIASVENTILGMEGGEQLMAENMFDGFDHTEYKEEVEDRWGQDAYAKSDAWWRSMSAAEKKDWQQRQAALAADWAEAANRGAAPDSDEAQALAKRQADWLGGIPGTPGSAQGRPTKEYFVGLGELYVADERFAANYRGTQGATFVRDAMKVYAEKLG
ncbi:MerR family transcriptional regulator [Leifsonia flava]|uniref:MerR family transcriptional regulator n=1 Tax=Orlajensenia leifsoniae TaxID=2561933 RepID=A0A4Y9QT40_9MICO|nr:MerR family transcriptional regulator [Leifsonia flava]TFV95300.1 MerR family transcriptional regulator [Leifsonia flava]